MLGAMAAGSVVFVLAASRAPVEPAPPPRAEPPHETPWLTHDADSELAAALRRRWGRPRVGADETWTWHRADRVISANLVDGTIAIRRSEAR